MDLLPDNDSKKLAKLCEMLASNYEGERANAGEMASKLIAKHNITWTDLVFAACRQQVRTEYVYVRTPQSPKEAGVRWKFHQSVIIDYVMDYMDELSQWEQGFMDSLDEKFRTKRLSEKQWDVLERIAEKVGFGA